MEAARVGRGVAVRRWADGRGARYLVEVQAGREVHVPMIAREWSAPSSYALKRGTWVAVLVRVNIV